MASRMKGARGPTFNGETLSLLFGPPVSFLSLAWPGLDSSGLLQCPALLLTFVNGPLFVCMRSFLHMRACVCPRLRCFAFLRMVVGVAGTVGGSGIERIKGTDKEGLLDVSRIDR